MGWPVRRPSVSSRPGLATRVDRTRTESCLVRREAHPVARLRRGEAARRQAPQREERGASPARVSADRLGRPAHRRRDSAYSSILAAPDHRRWFTGLTHDPFAHAGTRLASPSARRAAVVATRRQGSLLAAETAPDAGTPARNRLQPRVCSANRPGFGADDEVRPPRSMSRRSGGAGRRDVPDQARRCVPKQQAHRRRPAVTPCTPGLPDDRTTRAPTSTDTREVPWLAHARR
jgi:hypothetical protein